MSLSGPAGNVSSVGVGPLANSAGALNDPPDEDFHEGQHHDANLSETQRGVLHVFAPNLLVNSPHPWRQFMIIVVSTLGIFVAVVVYIRIRCPTEEAEVRFMSYSRFTQLVTNERFACLKWTGIFC